MVVTCMTYSDQKLIPILQALSKQNTTITEIASKSGIPYGTVKRRLRCMQSAGVIAISGSGRRWGFSIEVINAKTSD